MNLRAFIFYLFSKLFLNRLIQNKIASYFFRIFGRPVYLKKPVTNDFFDWLKNEKGCYITWITIVLLFIINAILSYFNGTLFCDDDEFTYNFLEDWPNLVNYILLCPIYVTVGMYVILKTRTLEDDLSSSGLYDLLSLKRSEYKSSKLKKIVLFAILLLVTYITILVYTTELEDYGRKFWFQEINSNHEIWLSFHGFYYIVTNLLLNFITVLVIAVHFEHFFQSVKLGSRLKEIFLLEKLPSTASDILNEDKVKTRLKPYINIYGLSKVLVIVYLANMYTWKAQSPDFIGMLDFTIVLLAVLGAALVTYPRYHIQYWLYKVWNKNNIYKYPEIRDPFYIGLANLADYIILGQVMLNLIIYVINKLDIPINTLLQ